MFTGYNHFPLNKPHKKAADIELSFIKFIDHPITAARTNDLETRGQLVKWCLFTLTCLVCGRALRLRFNSRKMASSRSGMKPFVTKFHGKTQLTSTEFMEVFRKYDKDGKLCRIFIFALTVRQLRCKYS